MHSTKKLVCNPAQRRRGERERWRERGRRPHTIKLRLTRCLSSHTQREGHHFATEATIKSFTPTLPAANSQWPWTEPRKQRKCTYIHYKSAYRSLHSWVIYFTFNASSSRSFIRESISCIFSGESVNWMDFFFFFTFLGDQTGYEWPLQLKWHDSSVNTENAHFFSGILTSFCFVPGLLRESGGMAGWK